MNYIDLSREELYEKVWQVPLRKLAPELGMSDRGLGKVCIRLEIPLPGIGFWRKVELGHKVKKEALPAPSETCQRYASFRIEEKESEEPIKDDPLVVQAITRETKPENKIQVPETIPRLHALAKSTLAALRSGYTDKYGRLHASGEGVVTVTCSKMLAPRVARLLHVLIRELEKRGQGITLKRYYYKYSYSSSEVKTYIEYAGEDIEITVMEKGTQIKHPSTAKKGEYDRGPTYERISTGQLVLKVENAHWYNGRQSWSDKASKLLEEQLNTIMIDLAKIAVHLRRKREEEEKKEREEERQKLEAEQLRQRQLEEQKRIEHLEGLYSQWIKAKQIREFIALAEKLPINTVSVGMEKQEWLDWAMGYADRLDPLVLRTRASEY
jgi:hypothetical protein